MKTIGLAAMLALTSTAAFAGGFQFSLDGGTVRIDLDDNCSDRLCASVSWQERGSRERRQFRLPEISTKTISKYIDDVPKPRWNSSPAEDDEDGEEAAPSSSSKPSSKSSSRNREAADSDEPAPPSRARRDAPDSDEPAPPSRARRDAADGDGGPSARVASPSPASGAAESAPESDPPPRRSANRDGEREPDREPSAERDRAPESTKVANVAPRSKVEPASRPSRPSPVGEWLVEDGEGKIRIEECGDNMCGYVSAAKNANAKDRHNPDPSLRDRPVIGTPILIDMKPNGKRWSGRIYNVKDGRSYTAHISLKSAETLRVEGCAFGGMICGGQNWSRVD